MSAAVACLWSALVLQSVYGSGEFGPVGSPDQRLVAQKGKMSIFYRVSLFSSIANKHTGFFFFRIFSNSEIGRPAFFSRKSTGMGGPSAALYFILLLFFVSKSFLFYYILLSGARPRRNKDASTQKKKEAAQKEPKTNTGPHCRKPTTTEKTGQKRMDILRLGDLPDELLAAIVEDNHGGRVGSVERPLDDCDVFALTASDRRLAAAASRPHRAAESAQRSRGSARFCYGRSALLPPTARSPMFMWARPCTEASPPTWAST